MVASSLERNRGDTGFSAKHAQHEEISRQARTIRMMRIITTPPPIFTHPEAASVDSSRLNLSATSVPPGDGTCNSVVECKPGVTTTAFG
jgi:hypothetical protein